MLRVIVMTVTTATALAAAQSSPLLAATYYVDRDHSQASDHSAGTEDSPWKTINHAARVLQAGDTVLVKSGTYDVGVSPNWAAPAVGPVNAGTVDAPITFQACRGHRVTITTSGGQAAIGSNRDYVVWDGFSVDMADRMKGILIFGARGCVVRYCEVKGNYIDSGDNHDGIRIERAPDCRIHHNVIHGVKGNSQNSAGIKVYSKGVKVYSKGVKVYSKGVKVYSKGVKVYSKGVKHVTVEDNYIHDNTAGVFDKDLGVDNTYRRNYFTRNRTDFYGNNQGGPAQYFIYDNVFDGNIELHASNTGTEIHDNLVRARSLATAWAGGVTGTKIWNNIVISKSRSIMACQNKRQDVTSAVAYMDYNIYNASPVYEFGEYTANRQRLSLDQMQSAGFEEHSCVVSSIRDLFEDESNYRLLPEWKAAGKQAEPPGPEDIATVIDVRRYGPVAVRR